jgi:transcriptional regulator with GAF, ATPase, and Fis domain
VGQGEQRLEVAREFAAAGEGVTFSRSVIDRVLQSGEPVLSVDAASDDRFDGSRSISHLSLRSVLAVPLVFRGELLGAAYVDHRLRRGNFDATDLAHMEDFADLAALAVAQTRALAAVRSQAAELERQRTELAELLDNREAALVNLREEVRSGPERKFYRGMVGSSASMQRVFRLVDRLADSEVPVVIYGESGTGKELVARAIHEAGARADKPFVAENCGAIPETLLESVLFGHARGAFTGAQAARPGLFEAADGGTIFLDEIGETSPAMQTKLLRVLQEGEVRRLGETKPRKVSVRVIAASNRNLEAMVEAGSFRQDLFYRINVVKLELPSLRDRREDIPALIEHFLGRHRREGEQLEVSASALRKLVRYPWPGNVRELENEVQRWLALCEERVMPDDLSPAIEGSMAEIEDPDDLELRPRVDRLERELIARAMERTGGNQTQAAQLLGLSRFGLQKKLKRLEETAG